MLGGSSASRCSQSGRSRHGFRIAMLVFLMTASLTSLSYAGGDESNSNFDGGKYSAGRTPPLSGDGGPPDLAEGPGSDNTGEIFGVLADQRSGNPNLSLYLGALGGSLGTLRGALDLHSRGQDEAALSAFLDGLIGVGQGFAAGAAANLALGQLGVTVPALTLALALYGVPAGVAAGAAIVGVALAGSAIAVGAGALGTAITSGPAVTGRGGTVVNGRP